MASFISTLSLLLLVLANGYFAIPVVNEFFSTTPFSSLYNDLTTDHPVNLRSASDDETTESPMIGSKQPRVEYIESEMSTSGDRLSGENVSRASSVYVPWFPSEPTTFTTEKSSIYPRDFTDLSFTTPESFSQVMQHASRGVQSEDENEKENETETETEGDKRAISDLSLQSATDSMLSFTSTSSVVIPELSTSESTTTSTLTPQLNTLDTSTKKYTGLLQDDQERVTESEYQPSERPSKTFRKPLSKPRYQPQYTSEETGNVQPTQKQILQTDDGTKDSSIPIAYLDQESSKDIPTVPNGVMVLDESKVVAVTSIPNKFSKINTNDKNERKPLNQGQQSSYSEEKKSNN